MEREIIEPTFKIDFGNIRKIFKIGKYFVKKIIIYLKNFNF